MSNSEWAWNDDAQERHLAPQSSYGYGYNGEKYAGGWTDTDNSILGSLIAMDYYTLRARSSEMFDTNLYAAGIVDRLVTNEVHTGLALEADPTRSIIGGTEDESETWSNHVETLFAAWGTTPEVCDYQQRQDMTLGEMTATARREAIVGGDVLVVLRQHPVTKLPTVQLIGGHLVQTPFPANLDKNIDHGVELDNAGRQIAYHVSNDDGFTSTRIAAYGTRSKRRQAWLMYGMGRRVGRVRGTPLLAIVLQSLKEVDKYRDSSQRKATLNAILSMWIEKTENKASTLAFTGSAVATSTVSTTAPNGTARQWRQADATPGMVVEELQVGEKIHAHQGGRDEGSTFPEFESAIIAAIAWYCQIPPEIARLSFDSNYSASAAALNEFVLYLEVKRQAIAQAFNRPIYEDWLVSSVLRGTVAAPGLVASSTDAAQFETYAAWTHAEWIGSVKPVTDRLKLVKAYQIEEEMGWNTSTRISRALNGTKFSTNARQIKRERAELPPRVEAAPPATVQALATAGADELETHE